MTHTDRVLEKMKAMVAGKIKVRLISVCGLAKYIYGAMYPELCKMSPLDILAISRLAYGDENSRRIIIKL